MVAKSPPRGASALAAKLQVIADAAPALRRAGVTMLVVDGDQVQLAELAPEAPAPTEAYESDMFDLATFRGDRAQPVGES